MAASTRRSGASHRNLPAWPRYMARYEPLERLGSGINGEVFKAWDTKENLIVAVKRLSATGTESDGLIYSGLPEIWRECRCLKTCDGIPSTVKLYDKVVPANTKCDSFLILEYAGRLNLRGYMELRARQGRPFSEDEVCRIMKQILEGAEDVHGRGILHMDMRPENVILDDCTEDRTQKPRHQPGEGGSDEVKDNDIVCKIGGFGMSRRKEQGSTQPEVKILRPYSAPELLLGSCKYDERVDTWGLGCIMADLLSGTGKPTFGSENDQEEHITREVFRVVDPKGIKDWPELKKKLPARKMKWKLKKLLGDPLRHRFPSRRLSSDGFKVLSGLLESNPVKRLTAAEALQKPWFKENRQ